MRVNYKSVLLANRLFNMLVTLFVAFCLFDCGESDMEAKIVGGRDIDISAFPYVAALLVKCRMKNADQSWKCGASIVNQMMLITAGHCVYGCFPGSKIVAVVGHRNHKKGRQYMAHSFMNHQGYTDTTVNNDIAIIRLKTPIQFGETVNRIALMKNPPYGEAAQVAGWGIINEHKHTSTHVLKLVNQRVTKTSTCQRLIGVIPKGSFCASSDNKNQYVAQGDSGSPLVVRGYIQLGLVSYKMPSYSASMIVYTDIGYYYDWIQKNIYRLSCS